MIDKAEIKCRFKRSVKSYEDNALVQKEIVDHLFKLLQDTGGHKPERVLEIGCGTGLLTRKLKNIIGTPRLFINDLVEEMCERTALFCGLPDSHCLVGDIEELNLPGQFDWMVSTSTFQWFSKLQATFRKFASHLNEGGLLMFNTFGNQNMVELRPFTQEGLKYLSYEEMATHLSPYFEILYFQDKRHKLYFSEPVDILRHLKQTGVNAGNSKRSWTKKTLQDFSCSYEKDPFQNKYPLTYHPMYFICRKR